MTDRTSSLSAPLDLDDDATPKKMEKDDEVSTGFIQHMGNHFTNGHEALREQLGIIPWILQPLCSRLQAYDHNLMIMTTLLRLRLYV